MDIFKFINFVALFAAFRRILRRRQHYLSLSGRVHLSDCARHERVVFEVKLGVWIESVGGDCTLSQPLVPLLLLVLNLFPYAFRVRVFHLLNCVLPRTNLPGCLVRLLLKGIHQIGLVVIHVYHLFDLGQFLLNLARILRRRLALVLLVLFGSSFHGAFKPKFFEMPALGSEMRVH